MIDDCFRPDDPRLSHRQALELLRDRLTPLTLTYELRSERAIGRYLAEDVRAHVAVPAHTNAAVDGYAFAHVMGGSTPSLAIAGRATAGHPFSGGVPPGACVRIFTGAVLPPDTDTVAMQEDCRIDPADPARVIIPNSLKPGANSRRAGEDIAAGQAILRHGDRLRPQDVAALAALGRDHIEVRARPRVGIVSTGDEVRAADGRPLAHGDVFDANSAMLGELAALAGADVTALGIWPDDLSLITRRLAEAAAVHDVILTSGGASKGDEDHIAASLGELGSRHFWQIAVKPGRPLLFGQINQSMPEGDHRCLVVGLPGNPVAVFVCALLYVQPLLRALQGGPPQEPRRFKLPAAFAFTGRKRGRREFWRAMLVETPTGLAVDKFKRDGSGLISGLMAADGLIDIPEDAGDVAVGDLVDFIPLTEFGIQRA